MRITAMLLVASIFLAGAAIAAESLPPAGSQETSPSSDTPGEAVPGPEAVRSGENRAPSAQGNDTLSPSPASAGETLSQDSSERPARTIPASRQRSSVSRSYISLDFTDVDLPVLIKFMSEQTGRNFVFDERVQGKATIISPRKMTEEDAYNVFLSVLQAKGFAIVDVGNAIKIVPARDIRQESIPTDMSRKSARHGGEFITRLIPLRYTESVEVVQLLTPLLSKDGLISPFPSANTIMLIDSSQNIERLLEILRMIDVESPGQMKLFQLKYAAAQELSKTLELLFPSATPAAGAATPAGRGAIRRSSSSAVRIIPEPRTNNLIVLAPPETLLEIADLVTRLDISTPSGNGKINVYYLENADAEETANVLSVLAYSNPTATQGPLSQQAAQQRAGQGPAAAGQGVLTAEFEGGVKVTADKATNSLVIVSSPNDYETLEGIIKKLDIRRRQVFVEAAILEIALDNAKEVGVEWRTAAETGNNGAFLGGTNFNFTGNANSLFTSLATGNPLLFSGTGLLAGGIGGSVTLPDGTEVPAVAAILRAAQTRSDIKILSSPHLLTQNNKEAEIIVGENVPFITSQSRDTTNLANLINTVERKDVGVTLRITPHIHESEFVSLDIYQESSALKESSALETSQVGPTTTKRSAKTTVLVKSGDTVLIGGIVQETKTDNESKVPILGSIPLLGWFFKYSSKSTVRTNLVILLTPHIIQEPGMFTKKLEDRQRKILKDFDQNNEHVRDALPPPQQQ